MTFTLAHAVLQLFGVFTLIFVTRYCIYGSIYTAIKQPAILWLWCSGMNIFTNLLVYFSTRSAYIINNSRTLHSVLIGLYITNHCVFAHFAHYNFKSVSAGSHAFSISAGGLTYGTAIPNRLYEPYFWLKKNLVFSLFKKVYARPNSFGIIVTPYNISYYYMTVPSARVLFTTELTLMTFVCIFVLFGLLYKVYWRKGRAPFAY
jgi:hypothetical protein